MKSEVLASQIEQHNQEIKQDLMMLRFKTQPRVLKAQLKEVLGPPSLLKGVIHMLNPMENQKVKEKVESVKEGVASAASSVKEVLTGASETVKDTVHSATSSVKDAVRHPENIRPVKAIKSGLGSVQEGVSSATREVSHQIKDQGLRVKTTVTENPWTSALIASGAVLTVAGITMALSGARHAHAGYNLREEIDRFEDDGNPNTEAGQGFIEDEHTQYGTARVRSGISNLLHQQPLLVGSAALFFGAAVGALLPHSSYEDRVLGKSSDRLIESVKESVAGTFKEVKTEAKKQVEDLKHMAAETGQEVKQTLLNGLSSL